MKPKDIEKEAKKKAKEGLKEMDADGSETVDFDEFSAWWAENKHVPAKSGWGFFGGGGKKNTAKDAPKKVSQKKSVPPPKVFGVELAKVEPGLLDGASGVPVVLSSLLDRIQQVCAKVWRKKDPQSAMDLSQRCSLRLVYCRLIVALRVSPGRRARRAVPSRDEQGGVRRGQEA